MREREREREKERERERQRDRETEADRKTERPGMVVKEKKLARRDRLPLSKSTKHMKF